MFMGRTETLLRYDRRTTTGTGSRGWVSPNGPRRKKKKELYMLSPNAKQNALALSHAAACTAVERDGDGRGQHWSSPLKEASRHMHFISCLELEVDMTY